MSKEIKNDNVILAKTKHRIRSIVEQPTEIHQELVIKFIHDQVFGLLSKSRRHHKQQIV